MAKSTHIDVAVISEASQKLGDVIGLLLTSNQESLKERQAAIQELNALNVTNAAYADEIAKLTTDGVNELTIAQIGDIARTPRISADEVIGDEITPVEEDTESRMLGLSALLNEQVQAGKSMIGSLTSRFKKDGRE